MTGALRRLVILGCGGHGRVCRDVARDMGLQVLGYCDPAYTIGTPIGDLKIISNHERELSARLGSDTGLHVAVGDQKVRLRIARGLVSGGQHLISLIHPSAVISPSALIGAGTAVFAQAVVQAETSIGMACILNTAATVDHDSQVGDGVHIAPGATLAGHVQIGEGAFLGAGAVVIPFTKIGAHVTVGAGAVVTGPVQAGSIVVGNPAKPLAKGS